MTYVSNVAVSGASGFIGSKLCEALTEAGYRVRPLVRNAPQNENEIFYDYDKKELEKEKLSECNAVIHLAGKNINTLWTPKVKKEIYDSRVVSTRFLAHAMANMEKGPRILLNASAIGFYGDRADQKLDEDSHSGIGFLAKLCVDWERGTLFAKKAGMRVVNMRFGIVLHKEGGMLGALLPLFKIGLGFKTDSGDQFMSFVTRDELISQILFVLSADKVEGPVNMVSFEPTTNHDFAKALSRVLRRPVLLTIPRVLLKALGDQGKTAAASVRAYPKVLLDSGFAFMEEHDINDVIKRLLHDA